MGSQALTFRNIIKAFGLVFGDIGTSPIYTLAVIFLLTERTEANFIGILSLIIWTLILLVTVEYAWLAMSLSKRGEGGTIVLQSILTPLLKKSRRAGIVALLSYLGVSLLIGDGVITPAITILSAMEGLLLVPGLEGLPGEALMIGSAIIAFLLFSIQKYGSGKVSGFFGPIMAVWFCAIALSGLTACLQAPQVIKALNPWYAVDYMLHHGLVGFFVLSEVILCATGGEALYADMGHLGRKPITAAWGVVFAALLLCYMGQTAFLIDHPEARNVLFEMVHSQMPSLYAPFLFLSLLATIIASQSLISGVFSIMYQGMATHIVPLVKVNYTSESLHSQIYINSVNWLLCLAVLLVLYHFQESHKLAAAYGFAVTGTMTITGVFMVWIFTLRKQRFLRAVALFICVINGIFLLSNIYKIPHGGYWSVLIALVPFTIIMIYTKGQKKLYARLSPMKGEQFVSEFKLRREKSHLIRGSAIFMLRDFSMVTPYIVSTMFDNGIIYEDNVMLSIQRKYEPFGVDCALRPAPVKEIRIFEVSAGYMEMVDIEKLLEENGIRGRVIFYGVEEILTTSLIWRVFAFIKKLSPSFVLFYKMPSYKVHGVIVRVTM